MAYIQDWGMRVQAQPQINTTRRAFLHLSQNENGRMLNIRITDVNIPTGSTAVLAGTKPDGTVYSQAGTLAGNTATFAEDVQMTAVAGTWDAKITVTNGGNCICTARITITIDPDTVAGGAVPSDSQLDGIIAECRAIADSVRKEAYGSPLVADAVEDMTDQSRVYVYTGSESGMTAGHWYYWNGSAWTDGGVYNAAALDTDKTLSVPDKAADGKATGDALALKVDKVTGKGLSTNDYTTAEKTKLSGIAEGATKVEIDSTLSTAGKAADAKETGDKISELKEDLSDITEYKASKNLFNDNWLATPWTKNNNEYYGTLNAIYASYGPNTDGFPITFESDTQYALSFKVYTETTRDDSVTGLNFRFIYSDNTQDNVSVTFPTTTDSWRSFSLVSDLGKTISKLIVTYGTGGATVWHLKEVQIEKGTTVTTYQKYGLIPYSALDSVCRNEKVDKIAGKQLSTNDFTDTYKSKLDSLSNDPATVTSNGLMSSVDKQKLDNILSPVSITVTGSGIYKNASAYNFLPTNDAITNSNALQSIVTGGGTIIVDMPGVYNICRSCLLDSNTTIIFGANVYLNLVVYDNLGPVYPFINRGAFANTKNTDISIYGLYLIANNISLSNPDVTPIYGQRGYIAFRNVERIIIKNCTIMDGSSSWYNVHVQQFNDVVIDTLEVHGRKDGIHLGVGSNYIIRNCIFETNDDAIAINAHDYPTGTSELGWIENGIIDNIRLVSAPSYNKSRGIYMLGGCWSDWSEGMTVREYGDAVVSNGRIYRTVGTIDASKPTITSEVQPTHLSGIQTYSDGVTWLMAQDENIGYTAGVKNLRISNIYINRTSRNALTMNFDDDAYSRSVYPGADLPVFENISLENLVTSTCDLALMCKVPAKNVRLSNIDWVFANLGGMAYFSNADVGAIESSIGFSNCYYTFDSTNHRLLTVKDNRIVNIMVVGSLGNFGEITPTCNGDSIIVSDDIGLTKEA